MIDNIIDSLNSGHTVIINYTSLNSGKEITFRGTSHSPHKGFAMPQNRGSDVLVLWDLDTQRWEDIKKDTIVGWSRVHVS